MKALLKLMYTVWVIHCINGAAVPVEEETELILVSVIFRHGARTTYKFYPNDPNKNKTFYPVGYGGLTNEGKLGEYKLGQYIRKYYGEFLGEHYSEDEVYVRSSDVTRTKMSALLVAAGLYPPSKIQQWHEELMWQPIPVIYKSPKDEDIFHPFEVCPYKSHVIEHLPEVKEVQELFIKPFAKTFRYIQENSGKNISHPADVQDFYFILETENDMNLIMPSWTKNIFPEPAHSIAAQVYGYHNYNKEIKRINCGYMLKKILDDSKEKIDGKSKMKIFLYSGHESTLGYMLDALILTSTHVPPYGSAIFFEVHRGIKQSYIKIRYRNGGVTSEPVDLKVPGCDVLCPFEEFIKLHEDLIPTISVHEACQMDKVNVDKEVSQYL